METIIVAVLALAGTLGGSYLSNRKSAALIAYRLEQVEGRIKELLELTDRTYRLEGRADILEGKVKALETRVKALEGLTERTYELESRTDLQEEQIKTANHRIGDLEDFHKGS